MIFGVTILVFFIMALSPIDQAYSVLGENATEAQAEQYREEHGLNDPILVQYGNFIVGLVQGDLGTYGANNASVADRIGEALPVTLQLTFFGIDGPTRSSACSPSPASPRRRSGWRCS